MIPTGGGKTRAALVPFLQSCAFNDGTLPQKAVYVTPMRVLATQFNQTCRDLLERDLNPALVEPLRARYRPLGREGLVSIQTGETPDDPQFESLITACTIDQLLASALSVPYSVDGTRANINVGLLVSAYLILDEPHLYPLTNDGKSCYGAFTTTIELLRQLKGLTRFVFMSATLSRPLVERLSEWLDAEIIEASEEELSRLAEGRARAFYRAAAPLSAEQVIERHRRCSLVVCNRVERAQELYLQLDELIRQRAEAPRLLLLHSRFTDEDRHRQGEELHRLLGPAAWQEGHYEGENVIVVATQVIEVGLDISVETLHTELAPANSLIQRAGRCARFPHQQGQVFVYPPATDEQGQPLTLPYEADLCQRTWEALAEYDGQVMRFQEEHRLLDRVHCSADLQLLQRYEEGRLDLQGQITASLKQPDPSTRSSLIRDDLQVALLVHDAPEEEIRTAPWCWQLFSLRPSLLQGRHWSALQERASALGLEWVCKEAVPKEAVPLEGGGAEGEEDSRREPLYTWQPVTNPTQITGALVLALPQALVTYDHELGLVFRDGRLPLPQSWRERLDRQPYQSRRLKTRCSGPAAGKGVSRQRYEEHIGGLADAYHYGLYHELAYAMRRLEGLMGLQAGTVDQAIQLAVALHDLGKLSQSWQTWARAWEHLYHEKKQLSYTEPGKDYYFAKTTYDIRAREERQWQQELQVRRPNHACESVALGRSFILESLGVTAPTSPNAPVVRAVCYAIARHHTTGAHEHGAATLAPGALQAVEAALALVRRDASWRYDLQKVKAHCDSGDLFPETADAGKFSRVALDSDERRRETWLAFLITRALRLADQRADLYR